jgi:hypothetical protein
MGQLFTSTSRSSPEKTKSQFASAFRITDGVFSWSAIPRMRPVRTRSTYEAGRCSRASWTSIPTRHCCLRWSIRSPAVDGRPAVYPTGARHVALARPGRADQQGTDALRCGQSHHLLFAEYDSYLNNLSIKAAVLRMAYNGADIGQAEAITVPQAILLYTGRARALRLWIAWL